MEFSSLGVPHIMFSHFPSLYNPLYILLSSTFKQLYFIIFLCQPINFFQPYFTLLSCKGSFLRLERCFSPIQLIMNIYSVWFLIKFICTSIFNHHSSLFRFKRKHTRIFEIVGDSMRQQLLSRFIGSPPFHKPFFPCTS